MTCEVTGLIGGEARDKAKPAYLYCVPNCTYKTQPAPQPTCCSRAAISFLHWGQLLRDQRWPLRAAAQQAPWRMRYSTVRPQGSSYENPNSGALEPPPAPRQLTLCLVGAAIFENFPQRTAVPARSWAEILCSHKAALEQQAGKKPVPRSPRTELTEGQQVMRVVKKRWIWLLRS